MKLKIPEMSEFSHVGTIENPVKQVFHLVFFGSEHHSVAYVYKRDALDLMRKLNSAVDRHVASALNATTAVRAPEGCGIAALVILFIVGCLVGSIVTVMLRA